MAIILACGWEVGHRYVWNTVTGGTAFAIGGAFAHTGNYGIELSSGGGANPFLMTLPSTPSAVYMSCWLRLHDDVFWARIGVRLGDGTDISFVWDPATISMDAYVNLVKVADGVLLTPLNTWFHFQAYIYVNNAGQIMTRINGYNDINYSGDTQPGASDIITHFSVHCSLASNEEIDIDDLVFDDADWPGDVRIEGLVPNGVGDITQWSPFPGGGEANWQDVDEHPPDGDATYVYVGTDGQDDLYELEDWVAAGHIPLAVVQYAYAKKMSVDATAFQFLAREGIATEVSGLQTLTINYTSFQIVLNTKPTGGVWTDAAIDDLQGGQRSVI